jgi:hypothetical protein
MSRQHAFQTTLSPAMYVAGPTWRGAGEERSETSSCLRTNLALDGGFASLHDATCAALPG